MADGSLNKSRAFASKTHLVPPMSDFAFQSIGKQPDLLKRMRDVPSGENSADHRYSRSLAPDPEVTLMPSESSTEDIDGQNRMQSSKRNRLLDALAAPNADLNTDDMHVDGDDVNGVSRGHKEAHPGAPLISRLQLQPTSVGQPTNTSTDAAKSSTVQPGETVPAAKMGNSASQLNPTVPPTPPPENNSPTHPSASNRSNLPHDALQAARLSLQTLNGLDFTAAENITEIRELAQAAKVESTSISLAAQKATSIAQRALACAQEAMQASQECVEVSRGAKKRWEMTIQGCEKFIQDWTIKRSQQADAIKRELAVLGNSIKGLEEEDSRRAHQVSLERKTIEEIPARALKQATAYAPSSRTPKLILPSSSSLPAPLCDEERDVSASPYMVALAEQVKATNLEFERLKEEVKDLRKLASDRNTDGTQDAQGHTKDFQQQPLAEHMTDPKVLEQALRSKLKSHKSLSKSQTDISSRLSSINLSAGAHAQISKPTSIDDTHRRPAFAASQIKQNINPINAAPGFASKSVGANAVKVEAHDPKLPAQPFIANPTTLAQLSPSISKGREQTLQLEYPPLAKMTRNTSSSHISYEGFIAPPLSPIDYHSMNYQSEDSEEPIHLHRQGSDPGNLPIILPGHCQYYFQSANGSPEESSRSASSHPSIKEELAEVHLPPPVAQRPALELIKTAVHPPITTLSEQSPADSMSSAFSTPALSATEVHPSGKSRNKKARGQQSKPQSRPPLSGGTSISVLPAFAQLPAKPIPRIPPIEIPAGNPMSSEQHSTGGNSQFKVDNGQDKPTAVAQVISQQNARALVSPRNASDEYRRMRHPPVGRPSIANSDRSYRPARSPRRSPSRSRSPHRGRDQAHRDYDHYSPPRSFGWNDAQGNPARKVRPNPPRLPRRVTQPFKRSPGPTPVSLAGTKRPHEDSSAMSSSPFARRRIEDSVVQKSPPVAAQCAESNSRPEGEESQRVNHPSPSSSGISLGSQVSAYDISPRNVSQHREEDEAIHATLASRLSDARQTGGVSASHLGNGGNADNRSNTLSRWNSPVPESSKPGLLERFSGPVTANHHQPNRGDPRYPARGRGRGRGGQPHALNNRNNYTNPNVSLLDRIQD